MLTYANCANVYEVSEQYAGFFDGSISFDPACAYPNTRVEAYTKFPNGKDQVYNFLQMIGEETGGIPFSLTVIDENSEGYCAIDGGYCSTIKLMCYVYGEGKNPYTTVYTVDRKPDSLHEAIVDGFCFAIERDWITSSAYDEVVGELMGSVKKFLGLE